MFEVNSNIGFICVLIIKIMGFLKGISTLSAESHEDQKFIMIPANVNPT